MLTAHEVARRLLEGPDVPVIMTLGAVPEKPEYVTVDFLVEQIFKARACVTEASPDPGSREGKPGFTIRWDAVVVLQLEPAARLPRHYTVAMKLDP